MQLPASRKDKSFRGLLRLGAFLRGDRVIVRPVCPVRQSRKTGGPVSAGGTGPVASKTGKIGFFLKKDL